MEEWKDIKVLEGLYQVSSIGRIKSLERLIIRNNGKPMHIRERIIKQVLQKFKNKPNKGHYICSLYYKGKPYRYLVHRLVAEVFIPIPEKYKDIPMKDLIVHHINENPEDNRVENLMWITKPEHQLLHNGGERSSMWGKHPSEETRKKQSDAKKGKFGKLHNGSKPILQFSKNGQFIREWDCAADAIRELGLSSAGNISMCCKGKMKTYMGCIWKYKNEVV